MILALERLRVLRAGRSIEGPNQPKACPGSARPKYDLEPRPVPTVSSTAGITPNDLAADWRVDWEERAAIREYDGGQAREHAEAEALREIIARMRDAGVMG